MKRRSPVKASKSRKAKSLKRKNKNYRSGLRFESLEDRRLLAFGDVLVNVQGQGLVDIDPIDLALQPPDTVGAVGQNYFLQAVNALGGSMVQIYDKATGNQVGQPFNMGIHHPANTACSTGNLGNDTGAAGDPILLYDHQASRWVLLEFGVDPANIDLNGNLPDTLCFLVSATSDPTSDNWHAYQFNTGSFPDYPKMGIGPTGYYVGSNDFLGQRLRQTTRLTVRIC